MTIYERLWARVDKSGDCWTFLGLRNAHGYGVLSIGPRGSAKKRYAHRVAWESVHGPISDGAILMHSCDNPPCVRPDHLRVGTRAENSADMVAKGRSQTGARHTQAKLTDDDVRLIRELGAQGIAQHRIAGRFGVSRAAVGLILQRKRWADR